MVRFDMNADLEVGVEPVIARVMQTAVDRVHADSLGAALPRVRRRLIQEMARAEVTLATSVLDEWATAISNGQRVDVKVQGT
jgi:hypothetical protein